MGIFLGFVLNIVYTIEIRSGGQRTLPYQPSNPIEAEEMTPFLCMDRCSADGWVFAGFEFSQECCESRIDIFFPFNTQSFQGVET